MNRREFLAKAGVAATWAGIAISVSGCGDDDDSPSNPMNPPGTPDVNGSVANSSGHSHIGATVTGAQLDAGNAVTLDLSGSGHTHTVQLTANEVMDIAAGTQVVKASSTDSGHDHTVTFN